MRLAVRRGEPEVADGAPARGAARVEMFDVVFVCPDCRASVERRITPIRRVETFSCVDGCPHVFQEPANIWAIALAMLGPAAKPS